MDAARQIRDLGRRLNEPDLVAVGLNGEGRALIKSGAVADGLALLDEAMVTVLEGRLDPFMTGVLYCHTIAACHEVGDVLRMSRWTELAERWLTTVPAEVTFGAMCAVHRAQLQLLRGAWDQAELGCMWLRASTSIGSTMPHRPGTSLPRFAGCAVRRRCRSVRRGARPRIRPAAGAGVASACRW